jgi:hypothetical protein
MNIIGAGLRAMAGYGLISSVNLLPTMQAQVQQGLMRRHMNAAREEALESRKQSNLAENRTGFSTTAFITKEELTYENMKAKWVRIENQKDDLGYILNPLNVLESLKRIFGNFFS